MNLDGKTAIVTGAAQGIGAACANAFAAHGVKVVLADIARDRCESTASEIASSPGAKTVAVHTDVGEEAQCEALLAACIDRFGHCDVLVNNAGIISSGTILDLSTEDFDRVLRVNLRGAFLLARLVARHMVEKKIAGAIINMASVNSILAIPNLMSYAVSKGGLAQLTRAMAVALAPHNIRVNAIGPGSIATDMLKTVMKDDKTRRMIMSRTPMGRAGEPEEVAKVAVFLASDYASYITGQTIYADGGRLALNYVMPVPE